MKTELHKGIFSFGGGTQSTACLVLAAQKKIPYKIFVFSNVGDDSESPKTLRYIDEFAKPYAEKHGLQIICIRKRIRGKVVTLLEHVTSHDNRSIVIPIRMEGGAPGRRRCTIDWKINTIARCAKKHGAKVSDPWMLGLGISTDEIHRMRTSSIKFLVHHYPLIDLRISRSECEEIILGAGLPLPGKSSCWFCPFKKKSEWAEMRERERAGIVQEVY